MTITVSFNISVPILVGGQPFDATVAPDPANPANMLVTPNAAAYTAMATATPANTFSVALADIQAAMIASQEVAKAPTIRG